MPSHSSRNKLALAALKGNNLIGQFSAGLNPVKPWANITEFVTSPKYLNFNSTDTSTPFPKQMTLLKLMFLETENMSAYDIETIEKWRKTFGGKESFGVQEDIWERVAWLKENGYRRFPQIQNVMGRRGSKGWLGGVLGAEQVAYTVSLDNWQKHYGIAAGKECWISSIATNFDQAKKFQFADIRSAIKSCVYLQPYINQDNEYMMTLYAPNDLRKIALASSRGQKLPDRDLATIRVIAMPAASSSGRGGVGLANFYDEFAFMLNGTGGPADSENVYDAYQPSLTQFKKDALTYIPSSPWTKVGKFYSLYQEGSILLPEYRAKHGIELHKEIEDEEDPNALTEADPTMLIYQNNSWAIYEDYHLAKEMYGYEITQPVIEFDAAMQIKEKKNKDKFKVEYRGQFAEVADAYLDPDRVDQLFLPFWDRRILAPTTYGRMDREYHAHIDPSTVNANFALCIGHLEEAPEDEYGLVWPHVIIDLLKVWKPTDFPNNQNTIDYVKVGKELDRYLELYPSMQEFSADQFNSAGILASLQQKYGTRTRIKLDTYTKQANMNRTEKFKSAINLGWIHSYRDNYFNDNEGSLLEMELKFLSEKNGQVVKQDIGPVTTKDLADAVMSVSVRLLERSLDNYQARMMQNLTPNFSNAGTVRAVDNVSTASRVQQNLQNMSEMANRGTGRLQYAPRWARRG